MTSCLQNCKGFLLFQEFWKENLCITTTTNTTNVSNGISQRKILFLSSCLFSRCSAQPSRFGLRNCLSKGGKFTGGEQLENSGLRSLPNIVIHFVFQIVFQRGVKL